MLRIKTNSEKDNAPQAAEKQKEPLPEAPDLSEMPISIASDTLVIGQEEKVSKKAEENSPEKQKYEPKPTVIPIILNGQNSADRMKEIVDRLETGIQELFESERYKAYLTSMAKFHNYSFNNTLLIAMQGGQLVAGYNKWRDKFHRNVKRGEKGIKILAPVPYKTKKEVPKLDEQGQPVTDKDGNPVTEQKEIQVLSFKIASVFDISQTEGEPLPSLGVNELAGNVDQYENFFKALEQTSPVPIAFEDISGGSHGYYHLIEKRIAIQENMSELQTLKTAIHEIAHAKLHAVDPEASVTEQTDRPDSRTREVQAESVAYTVCQHYGLDTSDYSFGYVAGWSSGKDLKELRASLEIIQTTAHELITTIDGHLGEFQQQRQTQPAPDSVLSELPPEQQKEMSDSMKIMLQTMIDTDMKTSGEIMQDTLEDIQIQDIVLSDGDIPQRAETQQELQEWNGIDGLLNRKPIMPGASPKERANVLIDWAERDGQRMGNEERRLVVDYAEAVGNTDKVIELINRLCEQGYEMQYGQIDHFMKNHIESEIAVAKAEQQIVHDATAEPIVTIIWSESPHLKGGQQMSLYEANAVFKELDSTKRYEREKPDYKGNWYDKTEFRIDFTMQGQPDNYEGRQDFGDGDGSLIEHIRGYHEYYAQDENWKNHMLNREGLEAWKADKAQRDMLLHEFVPYMEMHCNLSTMEQEARRLLQSGEDLTSEEIAHFHAILGYVKDCRPLLNQGQYQLPEPPKLSDFDQSLQDYRSKIETEIAQEAASAGMTVEEYAAAGYEIPAQEQVQGESKKSPQIKGGNSMPTEEEMREYALESRMPPTNVLKGYLNELSSDYQNDPYKLEELLEFKSRFYNYSVNNSMLIREYEPNATFVASPQTWEKLGYEVVQKEKAIPILYPVNPNTQDHTKFQRRSAFDITATNCPPEDYDLIRHTEHSPEQHPAMYQTLREYIQQQGLAVEEAYLSPSVRGEYYPAKNRMILNNQMDDTQKLDTLLHQFGHYIMQTADPNAPEAIREMEADAVTIMMSRQAGIKISNVRKQHFAASYQEAVNIPGFDLEKAMDTVNRVYRTWRVETDPLVQNALFEQQVSMEPEAPREMEEVLEQQTEQENYRILEKIAPEIVSGKSQSLRLERPGEESLLVERNGDRISIAQTYQKSHTDIANPNMDFVLWDGDRLSARNYQLDNAAGHYESAERGQDVDRNVLHRLNEMASKWLSHLEKTFPHTREVTREESPGNPSLRERFSDKMESIEKGIRHNWQERKRAQERERQARWEEKSLAEIQYLRDLDILQVARDMGFTPVHRKNHWTLREHDSVVFYDNNTFVRYSQEKGNGRKVGGSPIDFYAHFNNLLTGEAIREMKETYIRGRDLIGYRAREQPKKEKEEVPFILPTPEKGPWRRMFAYLTKTRGIDSDVVQHCIDKNLLYEETKYHNTVFVGRDHTGQAVFASKRSSLPNSKFRMDVEGSNQENGWQVNHPGAKLLVLTEAPIDAMSAMCIRKHMGRPVESANYLASCGTGKAISVLRNYMKKHPEITAIRIGMDNDDAGRKAAQNLRTWLKDEYPDVKVGGFIALPEGRDLNDAWRGMKSQVKTPAAKPPARKRQNTVEVE